VKFHFLENDETAKDMTWFLIGDNEAKAKCRFFVASLDNFKISVESQLRKSPNRFFYSSTRGMLAGLNFEKSCLKI